MRRAIAILKFQHFYYLAFTNIFIFYKQNRKILRVLEFVGQ